MDKLEKDYVDISEYLVQHDYIKQSNTITGFMYYEHTAIFNLPRNLFPNPNFSELGLRDAIIERSTEGQNIFTVKFRSTSKELSLTNAIQ